MQQKIVHVDSKAFPVEVIFKDRYEVDFYQREYVWEHKQIEDLISDLTNEFLKTGNPAIQHRTHCGMRHTSWVKLCWLKKSQEHLL